MQNFSKIRLLSVPNLRDMGNRWRKKAFFNHGHLPAAQDTPRYSINVPMANSSRAPLPATRLSPMAPTTSMSPGRSLCTFVGRVTLLPRPVEVMFLHGKGIDPGNDGCLRIPVGPGVMAISSRTAGVCDND